MQVPGDVFLMWWHGCKNNDAKEKKYNIMSDLIIFSKTHCMYQIMFFSSPKYSPALHPFPTHPPNQPTNRSLTHSPTLPPTHPPTQSVSHSVLCSFLPSFLPSLLPSFLPLSHRFLSIPFSSLPCLKASVCHDMQSMHSHKWSQRQITYRHVQSNPELVLELWL